jgi:hypothetical protein
MPEVGVESCQDTIAAIDGDRRRSGGGLSVGGIGATSTAGGGPVAEKD